MGSIRKTTEYGYCVKEMWEGGFMNTVTGTFLYVRSLFLIRQVNHVLLVNWRQVEIKILRVFFHHFGENPCLASLFYLPEKYITYSSRYAGKEMTIVCGFWLNVVRAWWLKNRCLHAFAFWSHCNQILPSLFQYVSWMLVHMPEE